MTVPAGQLVTAPVFEIPLTVKIGSPESACIHQEESDLFGGLVEMYKGRELVSDVSEMI
jgi:hypothetical protein